MAGVRRTKDRNGKFHKNWKFHFVDYTGKRRWGTGTSSKADTLRAAQALEEEHRLIKLGYRPVPKAFDKARSFADTRNEYLEWGEAQGGRGGRPWGATHARMRGVHLRFWGEELSLKELNGLMGALPKVEKTLRRLKGEGRSGKTVGSYSEALSAFCDWCVEREYLEADPLKGLKRFDSAPETVRRALTLEEISRVLDVAPLSRKMAYCVALATGLRKGELKALRVKHLDIEHGGLVLEASWTKNRQDGFQPLSLSLLQQLAHESEGKAHDDPLIRVPRNSARDLDKDLAIAGIPKATDEGKLDFHAFRTTYTTLVLESGASVKEAQSLLRHSTAELTMNTYARTRPERLRHVAETVGEMVQPAKKCGTGVQRAVVGHGQRPTIDNSHRGIRDSEDSDVRGFESRTLRHSKTHISGTETPQILTFPGSPGVSPSNSGTPPEHSPDTSLHKKCGAGVQRACAWEALPEAVRHAVENWESLSPELQTEIEALCREVGTGEE